LAYSSSAQSLEKLSEHLQSKYPQQSHLFQLNALKATLCETLARSLEKLNSIIEEKGTWKLPKLRAVNYECIEQLCLSPFTGNLCGELVSIYSADKEEVKKKRKVLGRIVRSLNGFVEGRGEWEHPEHLHIIV
jgi:hypothetical protein